MNPNVDYFPECILICLFCPKIPVVAVRLKLLAYCQVKSMSQSRTQMLI